MSTRRRFLQLLGLAPVAAPVVAAEAVRLGAQMRVAAMYGIGVPIQSFATPSIPLAGNALYTPAGGGASYLLAGSPAKEELKATLNGLADNLSDHPLPCAPECSVTCWDDCLDAEAMRAVEGRAGDEAAEYPGAELDANATAHAALVKYRDTAGNGYPLSEYAR